MTTQRQIEANRQNALKSTGPRTQHGKAIVSQNAIRHGLAASTPVIPGVESSAAWELHREATVQSLAPETPVEAELANRVALILWRLQRLGRYERDVTNNARRHAVAESLPDDTVAQIRQRRTEAGARLRHLSRLQSGPPDARLANNTVEIILDALDDQLADFDVFGFSAPEIGPDDITWIDLPDWTIERLRRLVAAIAQAVAQRPEALMASTIAQARNDHNAERARLRPYTRAVADLRQARILPQPTNLDQVIRYENHLTRQLERTLAQLRALQHHRASATTNRTAPPTDEFGETKPDPNPAPPSQPIIPDPSSRLCSHPDHEMAPPDHEEPPVTPYFPRSHAQAE